MDWFSSEQSRGSTRVSTVDSPTGAFADAITARYAASSGGANSGGGLMTPSAIPIPPTPLDTTLVVSPAQMAFPTLSSMTLNSPPRSGGKPPPSVSSVISPAAPSTSSPSATNGFAPLLPTDLSKVLSDPSTLILDLRPHTSYALSRIHTALSLAAPSTLLRRPAFGLDMLAGMIAPSSAAPKFSAWRSASVVVVYDADSTSAPPTSVLHGLLAKFAAQGVPLMKLRYIRGGFQAVCVSAPNAVDQTRSEDDNNGNPSATAPSPTMHMDTGMSLGGNPALPKGILQARGLPMQAFSLSSTASARGSTKSSPTTLPPMNGSGQGHRGNSNAASNPFFDNIRQNIELSGPGSNTLRASAISHSGSASGTSGPGHTSDTRILLTLPPSLIPRVTDIPIRSLRHIAALSMQDNAKLAQDLAMQFQAIEQAEQKRLNGVMMHHARETQTDLRFAFGITAGFEKGGKNRYRNIWPFEHSRVHLPHPSQASSNSVSYLTSSGEEFDDYINASHVHPLCTSRRYIATQGPLPATYADFWSTVWTQNVRVLVMLTREMEGAQVKCGRYWSEGQYGPIVLTRVGKTPQTPGATTGGGAGGGGGGGGGFFTTDKGEAGRTVRREFEIRHIGYPEAGKRRVTHVQYTGWDDMHIPEDARDILDVVRLVRDVNEPGERAAAPATSAGVRGDGEVDPKTGIVGGGRGPPPVMLHCSAGIGRTGGFIALDAVLDAVRREVRAKVAEEVKAQGQQSGRGGKEGGRDGGYGHSRNLSEAGRRGAGPAAAHERPGERERGGYYDMAPQRSPVQAHSSHHHAHLGMHAGHASGAIGARTPAVEHPPRLSALGPAFSPSQHVNPAFASPMPTPGLPDTSGELCYRPPRPLHGGIGPVPLDDLGAGPICAIVADMREQRMSLVQTLRQYVFVHMAAVQGALEVLDEERAAVGLGRR